VTSSPSINPDYPTTEPRMRAALAELVARRAGGDGHAPAIVWEADLFLRLCPAPTIGVTGTKGKTTTSALTHAILSADPGHRAVLGGNMGVPIVERLPELTPEDRVVFELSELQLPTLSRGTTVAVYTNVTADHVDRHGSVEAYRRVKHRLAELVDPTGALVLNLDDPIVAGYGDDPRARVVGYRLGEPPAGGLGVVDGWIVADGLGPILPVGELRIPGSHNVSNALAAVAVGVHFGLEPAAIRRAATAFEGVEHRLETVAIIEGIRYVNDSQGTQPDAVAAALRAFEPPIVLIAGGRAKDIDLAALGPVVAERAAGAVLIGESAADLEGLFSRAGLRRIERARTLDVAIELATTLAKEAIGPRPKRAELPPGTALATVLLSPAAASFDMFADYEARGRAFKASVAALAERRRS
jgi:UDP-N-acetylmuramoylalanine--D-glutamate ligase